MVGLKSSGITSPTTYGSTFVNVL